MNFLDKLRSKSGKLKLVESIIDEPEPGEHWVHRFSIDCFCRVNHELVCFFEFAIPLPYKWSCVGVVVWQFIIFDKNFGYWKDCYDGGYYYSIVLFPFMRVNW